MAWFDNLLLKSSSPRMRRKAVDNLSGSTRPSDTELLCASLQDPDTQVRCAAVRALAKKDTAESRRSLIGALKDTAFQVREAAARALGQLGNASVATALVASLRDPDSAVRISAAGALRSLAWKPANSEELALYEIALGNTPAGLSCQNVPEPSDPVQNRDTAFHRRLAAMDKKEKKDPARINALLADLAGRNLLVRLSAIHDLGEVDDPKVAQMLLTLLRATEPEIRLATAQVLSRRQDSASVHFVGLLQDPSAEVRLVAVEFLSRIRHQQIVQVLTPLLSDPHPMVREAAATAVREMRRQSQYSSSSHARIGI